MREKPAIVITQYEDIISYECNYQSKFVKVLIGIGSANSVGDFVPFDNQNYQYNIIDNENFDALMAANGSKPMGVFRKEDLWPFVDIYRQKIAEEEALLVNKGTVALNAKLKNTI